MGAEGSAVAVGSTVIILSLLSSMITVSFAAIAVLTINCPISMETTRSIDNTRL